MASKKPVTLTPNEEIFYGVLAVALGIGGLSLVIWSKQREFT